MGTMASGVGARASYAEALPLARSSMYDFGIGCEASAAQVGTLGSRSARGYSMMSEGGSLARPVNQGATVDIVCCTSDEVPPLEAPRSARPSSCLRSSCRASHAEVPFEVPRSQRAVQILSNPVYDEPLEPEGLPHSYRPSTSAQGPVPVPFQRQVDEDSQSTCSETYMTNMPSLPSQQRSSVAGCTVQSLAAPSSYDPIQTARRKTVAAEALGVQKTAGRKTVTQAFRKRVLEHHPDKGGNTVTFQALNAAYSNLTRTDDRE